MARIALDENELLDIMHTRVPAGIKVCSAQQRRRTPVDFARWLISLASQARRTVAA